MGMFGYCLLKFARINLCNSILGMDRTHRGGGWPGRARVRASESPDLFSAVVVANGVTTTFRSTPTPYRCAISPKALDRLRRRCSNDRPIQLTCGRSRGGAVRGVRAAQLGFLRHPQNRYLLRNRPDSSSPAKRTRGGLEHRHRNDLRRLGRAEALAVFRLGSRRCSTPGGRGEGHGGFFR